jgi:hypothetical protein
VCDGKIYSYLNKPEQDAYMQANRTYPKQTFPCDIRQRALNDFITSVKIFMKFGMEIMP